MADPRDRDYAELIVDDCLKVQPGWQVLVGGNPQARPLLEELCGAVARRSAYALLRVSFEGFLPQSLRWVDEVPMAVLATPAPLFSNEIRSADAMVFVQAPDNTRAAAELDPARIGTLQAAYRPDTARMMNHDVPWVVCQYPTPALAQGGGDRQPGVRRTALRRRTPRLGGRGRVDASCVGALRHGVRDPHRRGGHRPAAVARGTEDEGRLARRQPPRGRVLRLPGLPRGRSRSATSRRSTGAARSAVSASGSPVGSSSTPPPRPTRRTCSRRSTSTRARVASASSGSAAIPASPAT